MTLRCICLFILLLASAHFVPVWVLYTTSKQSHADSLMKLSLVNLHTISIDVKKKEHMQDI